MCSHEFGIVDNLEMDKEYKDYEPKKYNCISVDDDIINELMPSLVMKSYFHNTNRPDTGLAYCGITLIPPESLPKFENAVISSSHYNHSDELVQLFQLIKRAKVENKFIIHFGI